MITRALEQKAIFEQEVAEGERRLQQLLAEDSSLPAPAAPSQVMELQKQIDELVRERDMLRANHSREPPGVWCAGGPPRVQDIRPMPANLQELEGWISERNCDMRNALEFGDSNTVVKVGALVSQGTAQLASISRDVQMDGLSRSSRIESILEESDAKRRFVQVGASPQLALPSMLGNQG